jgi:cysteine desulfurase family protein
MWGGKFMIYLDNAATTFPKPAPVGKAVEAAIMTYGANPGRAGHQLSVKAGNIISQTRKLLATLFSIEDPMQIIFTLNATDALNLALKGFLKSGDHVITSSMEHNSVARPLEVLKSAGVEITKVFMHPVEGINPVDVQKAVRSNTKLIAITHASNVTGTLNPIGEIGAIAKEHHIPFLVDAAQTAGVFPIDVENLGIDMLVFPGHKGLLGPQGTGGLYLRKGINLTPLKQGGTGSVSESLLHPDFLPDKYESGTPNTPGIAGLGAGVKFVLETGIEKIHSHEEKLVARLLEELREIPGIKIYGPADAKAQAPVVAINLKDIDANTISFLLDHHYQIATRSGYHCAPDAHQTLGTLGQGVVRLSPGFFNTLEEIEQTIDAVREIAREMV